MEWIPVKLGQSMSCNDLVTIDVWQPALEMRKEPPNIGF